jgi:hypothetical protein
MLVAMPSPNGTNFENLYVDASLVAPSSPRLATDAMPTHLKEGDHKMRTNEELIRRARLAFDNVITDLARAADPDNMDGDAGVTADTCARIIRTMIMNLPPDEGDRLLEMMGEMANSGDPEMAVKYGRHGR